MVVVSVCVGGGRGASLPFVADRAAEVLHGVVLYKFARVGRQWLSGIFHAGIVYGHVTRYAAINAIEAGQVEMFLADAEKLGRLALALATGARQQLALVFALVAVPVGPKALPILCICQQEENRQTAGQQEAFRQFVLHILYHCIADQQQLSARPRASRRATRKNPNWVRGERWQNKSESRRKSGNR